MNPETVLLPSAAKNGGITNGPFYTENGFVSFKNLAAYSHRANILQQENEIRLRRRNAMVKNAA